MTNKKKPAVMIPRLKQRNLGRKYEMYLLVASPRGRELSYIISTE
jgi:hypothetical protein